MRRKFNPDSGPFVLEGGGMKIRVPNNRTMGRINVDKKANMLITIIGVATAILAIDKLGKGAMGIYRVIKSWKAKREQSKSAELEKSIAETVKFQPPVPVPMSEHIKNCRVSATGREFLGHTFLIKGTRNILYGSQKSFKSTLAVSLAESVATGEDHGLSLNLQGYSRTGAIHVDIYDAEHSVEDLVERYKGKDIPNLTFMTGFTFSSYEDYVSSIRKRAFEVRQDMLVIGDNSTKMFGDLTAAECNDFDTRLKDLQTDAKAEGFTITILTLMHSGKDTNRGPRGTSNFGNFSENVFAIKKTSSRFALLTLKHCRHYADGVSYVLERASDKFAMTYNPKETAKLSNNDLDYPDGHWDGESPIDACPSKPQQLTPEQIEELIQFYQASPKHGYGTCFKKFGRKFGFNSESTMTRFIKKRI